MSNPHPTPFKKTGKDANPNGRPKRDWTWSGLLESVANEVEAKSGKTFKDLVTRRLWIDAANGNIAAQKEILNRMDGLPMQRTDITSNGEQFNINIDGLIGLSKQNEK